MGDGSRTLWPGASDDVFGAFVRQSQERFQALLEERGFAPPIPPPAGFGGTPVGGLRAGLLRGNAVGTSVDEAKLTSSASASSLLDRKAAFGQRRSLTSGNCRPRSDEIKDEDVPLRRSVVVESSRNGFKHHDDDASSLRTRLGDEMRHLLPVDDDSPISPPSPFQHPFFQRQLGLFPFGNSTSFGSEPWARFSGFGSLLPRLPPILLAHARAQQQKEGRDIPLVLSPSTPPGSTGVDGISDTSGVDCHVSTTRTFVRYCDQSNGYKTCTETQFFDGASESESDDDEEEVAAADSNTEGGTSQVGEVSLNHVIPVTSRPISLMSSDVDTDSKRHSQAISTEPSEIDDGSSFTANSDLDDSCCPEQVQVGSELLPAAEAEEAIRCERVRRIATELLHTERTYVKVLHLIDQEFQFRVDQENRAHHLFPAEVIPHMFSNIKSIYKLHHDFLLPQLEERITGWDKEGRIGDIMKSFAPFLKMYTEYVRNFDSAMTLISQWQNKSSRFSAIMDDIQQMETCGNLTLQHHMLSPVQRIPRYELLLRDYLKKLPEGSHDRDDTEMALHLVSTAASCANEAMKKIDKFQKLLEVQESLGGAVELVSPTRELVREGRIVKISARSGDHQERYVFLLTDMLLLCSPRLMSARVRNSSAQLRLRARYNVDNLQVLEGDNLETANTFYLRDNSKSVELYTETSEEKESWLTALFFAIQETCRRKSSLRLPPPDPHDPHQTDPDLGHRSPMLVRADTVSACMQCGTAFSMVRRKHHCRACGLVLCHKCSNWKATLAFDNNKSGRVCRSCHETLTRENNVVSVDDDTERQLPDFAFRSRGVLEVSANDPCAVMRGSLQLKTHQRKGWIRRWFALHPDFVLYSFTGEGEEGSALTATPVPGFTVVPLQGCRNENGIAEKDKERSFKLHHAQKVYFFQAPTKEECSRWVCALQKASQAELPSPTD